MFIEKGENVLITDATGVINPFLPARLVAAHV